VRAEDVADRGRPVAGGALERDRLVDLQIAGRRGDPDDIDLVSSGLGLADAAGDDRLRLCVLG